MKSRVLGLLAVVALSALGGEKGVKNGDTLVFMGDSITQYGKERSHGYPHLVVKGLAANGIDVIWHGVGICGNTSADMVRRFDQDVLSKKPTVVTISAGVNDVWFGKVSFEQFCTNTHEMVAKAKAAGARVVLLSPTTAFGEGDNPGIRSFAAAVKKIAAEEKVAYAPAFEMIRAWIDDRDTPVTTRMNNFADLRATYDGVHMNPAGDRVLARATLKGLGLDPDGIAKAEATWNADETLVPLVVPPSASGVISVRLTDAEARAVSELSVKQLLDRGIPSLATCPKMEAEAPGATVAMTVTPKNGAYSYKAYDQLQLAARQLGVRVDEAVKCAVLRGARDARVPRPGAPVGKVNDVLVGATVATFDVTVASVGAAASACNIILRFGSGDRKLGEPQFVSVGENGSFTYLVKGLKPKTAYAYEMAFVNNASNPLQSVVRGAFVTKAACAALEPSGEDDTARIQSALDAAAKTKDTVTLGEGVFTLSGELVVADGASLVGQGFEKTTLRQTAGFRVVALKDGARLEGVTVTGGRTTKNWAHGAGVLVEDGTVTRCRVWYNRAGGHNIYGAGISIKKGGVKDSVVACNRAGATGCGGGIGCHVASGDIVIENCRVYGNSIANDKGGGIGCNPKMRLVNCEVKDNAAAGGEADVSGKPAADSENNMIGK